MRLWGRPCTRPPGGSSPSTPLRSPQKPLVPGPVGHCRCCQGSEFIACTARRSDFVYARGTCRASGAHTHRGVGTLGRRAEVDEQPVHGVHVTVPDSCSQSTAHSKRALVTGKLHSRRVHACWRRDTPEGPRGCRDRERSSHGAGIDGGARSRGHAAAGTQLTILVMDSA